ncbi:Uncharacterised protein [Mycobacteroides abscessus subsp. abscessus]|nr:Uncharacterised protein [Mycobacteroides abscessus subsp. bolletii]SHV78398.1 Uncharacterised protein [Mycobacteroides abscessus subsp. bolletii]SKM98414.1 Uncharacterised protein [Mycobacteroides abscessus subsp. bolletii]SKO84909.1 Uncharacterised protein [Mycobacteroides abscessus subsp. abscessus]SKT57886.1 Uncharacterised protein [Mycobacteroides abscessus subsp. bolletii]
MLLPVEVVTQRLEEIIEVGDVIAQPVHGRRQLSVHDDRLVGDFGDVAHQLIGVLHLVDHLGRVFGLLQHVVHTFFSERQNLQHACALQTDLERYRCPLDRAAFRPSNALHHGNSRYGEETLGQFVENHEVRGIAHIVVCFEQHDIGRHARFGEVPLRCSITHIGGNILGHIQSVVVTGLITGQSKQANQPGRASRRQDGARPTDDRRADPAPSADHHSSLGLEQPETTAEADDRRHQRHRHSHRHRHADRSGYTHGLEIGQPRETKAENSSRNRQPGGHYDLRDTAVGGVKGGLAVFAALARFLISPREKYAVVRSDGDAE